MANRRQKDQRRNQEKTLERREHARQAMRALRIEEFLDVDQVGDCARRRTLREVLLSAHYPRPKIVKGEDCPDDVESRELIKQLAAELSEIKFDCPLLGSATRVIDYCEFILPMLRILIEVCESLAGKFDRERFEAAREHFKETISEATQSTVITAVALGLRLSLIEHGRFDEYLYSLTCDVGRTTVGNPAIIWVLNRTPQIPVSICIDRELRPAFRIGQPLGIEGISWVEWKPALLGLQNNDRTVSVYVQNHALKQLIERVAFLGDVAEWLLFDSLWISLFDPEIVPQDNRRDSFLVAFKVFEFKLGYLPVVLVDDKVVVRSFLTLTMDGTPEGAALRNRLKLRRQDKEWLGLDDLTTLLFSDIKDDPELVSIFEECGCGHLFEMADVAPEEFLTRGCADRVRKFLRLGSGSGKFAATAAIARELPLG